MRRGEVLRLTAPRGTRGHEQRGERLGVVVQAGDLLALSTVLVAPTSTSARPASFRPEIEVDGTRTRVLVEQLAALDPARLGESRGMLTWVEMTSVDRALQTVLGLSR